MGCAQSKIENEEAVMRCRDRKKCMKEAVSFRNAFAAAHSAYVVSVKNTGAALSDYARGEVSLPSHHPSDAVGSASSSSSAPSAVATAIQPPMEKLQPPPPPDPGYPPSPLQRSANLPEILMPKKKPHVDASIRVEEDDEDAAADDPPSAAPAGSDAPPAPPPPLPPQPQRSTTPPPPPMPEPKGRENAREKIFFLWEMRRQGGAAKKGERGRMGEERGGGRVVRPPAEWAERRGRGSSGGDRGSRGRSKRHRRRGGGRGKVEGAGDGGGGPLREGRDGGQEKFERRGWEGGGRCMGFEAIFLCPKNIQLTFSPHYQGYFSHLIWIKRHKWMATQF